MSKTIILGRHGEVDNPKKVFYGRSLDISLSKKGRRQIDSLGRQISKLNIKVDVIITSPLVRALQTSEIFANHFKAPIVHNSLLVDAHIPALIGKSLIIRKELHTKGEDEYSGEWIKKGNETSAQITKRMLVAFRDAFTQTSKKATLIVGHGDPLAFLHYALENPDRSIVSIVEILEMGYGLRKGSAVILEFDEHQKIKSKKNLNARMFDRLDT